MNENRNMDILRDRNVVDAMSRNIIDSIDTAFPAIDMPEIIELVEKFGADIEELIADLNSDIAGII